jgi:hypothetical protein
MDFLDQLLEDARRLRKEKNEKGNVENGEHTKT